jgi:GH25 family lysozyme M1 (1,4-beta-N-acetylmuramidase)
MASRREFFRRCAGLAAVGAARPVVAQGSTTEGIDVSHWQGVINWGQVAAAGIRFSFMKATEHTTFVDSRFSFNWAQSKANGILRGAYHYGRPGFDPVAQARHFYNVVRPTTGDLPCCLDIEADDGLAPGVVKNWIQRFCQEIRRKMGRPPVIYTGFYFWRDEAGNSPNNYDTRLWMARWSTTPYPLPIAWSDWTFWQYTSTGSVPGINGNVDRDQFNGSLSALQGVVLP